MNGSAEPVTRQKFEAEIILKAWKDPEYKKRLLTSPKELVQEELRKIRPGVTLPDNLQVYVHEETPNAVHMTLPVNPAEYGELSGDEWMDPVTGGVFGVAVTVVLAVAAAAAANIAGAVNTAGIGNVAVVGNVNTVANANVAVNTV